MPGKFRNSTDEALHEITLHGMCTTSGNVEAPTGWFGAISIDPGEDVIGNYDLQTEGVTNADLVGHWMIYEDSLGFVETQKFSTEKERDRVYDRLDRQYGKWDSE